MSRSSNQTEADLSCLLGREVGQVRFGVGMVALMLEGFISCDLENRHLLHSGTASVTSRCPVELSSERRILRSDDVRLLGPWVMELVLDVVVAAGQDAAGAVSLELASGTTLRWSADLVAAGRLEVMDKGGVVLGASGRHA